MALGKAARAVRWSRSHGEGAHALSPLFTVFRERDRHPKGRDLAQGSGRPLAAWVPSARPLARSAKGLAHPLASIEKTKKTLFLSFLKN